MKFQLDFLMLLEECLLVVKLKKICITQNYCALTERRPVFLWVHRSSAVWLLHLHSHSHSFSLVLSLLCFDYWQNGPPMTLCSQRTGPSTWRYVTSSMRQMMGRDDIAWPVSFRSRLFCNLERQTSFFFCCFCYVNIHWSQVNFFFLQALTLFNVFIM